MPSCPRGSVLLQSSTLCGLPCSSGQVVYEIDDGYCVTASCPPQMTPDTADNSTCWKTPVSKGNNLSCSAGYTEWLPGNCYIDCPVGYRENGQSCLIPTLKRRTVQPVCPVLFSLEGDSCNASPILLLIIFGASVAFFLAVWYKGSSVYVESEKTVFRRQLSPVVQSPTINPPVHIETAIKPSTTEFTLQPPIGVV